MLGFRVYLITSRARFSISHNLGGQDIVSFFFFVLAWPSLTYIHIYSLNVFIAYIHLVIIFYASHPLFSQIIISYSFIHTTIPLLIPAFFSAASIFLFCVLFCFTVEMHFLLLITFSEYLFILFKYLSIKCPSSHRSILIPFPIYFFLLVFPSIFQLFFLLSPGTHGFTGCAFCVWYCFYYL